MKMTVTPSPLCGGIKSIASKSQAHRLLICAALSDGKTRIECPELSDDIRATALCLSALGAGVSYDGGGFNVSPIVEAREGASLDCGESGSTLRFLLPVVCALGGGAVLRLRGRLPRRPLSPLWEELEAHGCRLSRPESDLVSVAGRLRGGDYTIDAGVSSQFISGLLFALPLLAGGGSIRLTGRLESAGYIEMTRKAQSAFGVDSGFDGAAFTVPGGQRYVSPGSVTVEGDWSNAAFWIVADALSDKRVECRGLDPGSAQGDRRVLAEVKSILGGGATVDAADIPDLVPVLSVLAAVSPGTTRFVNAGRLRIKESDRIKAVCAMLSALGGDVSETEDGLVVSGRRRLRGGTVDSFGDHRIAMSAAIAAAACEGEVVINGAEAVSKSYPAFWEDLASLGGRCKREE